MTREEIEDIVRQVLLKKGHKPEDVEALLIKARNSPNSITNVLGFCDDVIRPIIDAAAKKATL